MPVVTITGEETPGEKLSPRAIESARKNGQSIDSIYGIPPEEREIWPGSTVTVFAVRDHRGRKDVVWKGGSEGPLTINLSHGLYYYSCTDIQGEGYDNRKFVGKFLVGLTMKMFKRWSHMLPRAKPRQTSQGVSWGCREQGCRRGFTTSVAALLHEFDDHDGKNPFRGIAALTEVSEGEPTILGDLPVDRTDVQKVEAEMPKKRRGRPPKKVVEAEAANA